jgi:hypothetical protein
MKKTEKKKLLYRKKILKPVVIILCLTGLLLRIHTANSNNPDKKIRTFQAADIRSIHVSCGKGSVYLSRSLTDDLTVSIHSGPGSILFRQHTWFGFPRSNYSWFYFS